MQCLCRVYEDDRRARAAQNTSGDAPNHGTIDSRTSMGCHDDEIRLSVDCGHANAGRRGANSHVSLHTDRHLTRAQWGSHLGQIVACSTRARFLLLVEIGDDTPATVITDDVLRRRNNRHQDNLAAWPEHVQGGVKSRGIEIRTILWYEQASAGRRERR